MAETSLPSTPGHLRLSPGWLLFAALALAIPVAPLLLHRRPPPLPLLGELPAFSLTDQRGRAFGRDDLRGKVWVADFVFTSCSDACPRLTQRMRSLQDRIDPHEGVGLLSISVDPERDTSQKLRDYGQSYGARDDQWLFLTGSPTEVERTVVKGFKMAMAKVPLPTAARESDDELRAQAVDILHGDRLVLVDSSARIRGYYVADDAGVAAILRAARALAAR
ncbi:MAG: SCO family protein [Myxococcales bacterium]